MKFKLLLVLLVHPEELVASTVIMFPLPILILERASEAADELCRTVFPL